MKTITLFFILTISLSTLTHAKEFDPRCSEVFRPYNKNFIRFSFHKDLLELVNIDSKKSFNLFGIYYSLDPVAENLQRTITDARNQLKYIDVKLNSQKEIKIIILDKGYPYYSRPNCIEIKTRSSGYDTTY